MSLKEKIELFNELCGNWDFRDIDMTEPHLEGIEINENTIKVYCELYSPEFDDYVSCDGGLFKNKWLVSEFNNLDLRDDEEVIDFINEIEDLIDWDKVSDNLYNQVEKESVKDLEI